MLNNAVSCIYIVLYHRNNRPQVDIEPHIFIPSQPFLHLNDACFPEWDTHPRSTALAENSLTITPSMLFVFCVLEPASGIS